MMYKNKNSLSEIIITRYEIVRVVTINLLIWSSGKADHSDISSNTANHKRHFVFRPVQHRWFLMTCLLSDIIWLVQRHFVFRPVQHRWLLMTCLLSDIIWLVQRHFVFRPVQHHWLLMTCPGSVSVIHGRIDFVSSMISSSIKQNTTMGEAMLYSV